MKTIALSIVPLLGLLLACEPVVQNEPDAGGPRKCVGGVLRPDGTCEAKCDPAKCLANNTCVDNKCVLKCDAHSDCLQYAQSCKPAVEDDTGAAIFTCQNVPIVEYGDPCPNGNECSNICLRSGPGDARSYCTVTCRQDVDCPGGYECGYVRDPHTRCNHPTPIGNNNFCGTTQDPCIAQSLSPLDGTGEYVVTSYCLARRLCTKKEVCASCTSDVDCSWALGDLDCVPLGEDGNRCLARCAVETDCDNDKTCQDGHCVPKFGACKGSGVFCHPCRFDTDCAQGFACAQLHGNEKACIDMSFSTSCSVDADCPLSPSGRNGDCITLQSGARRCYAPTEDVNGSYSCW